MISMELHVIKAARLSTNIEMYMDLLLSLPLNPMCLKHVLENVKTLH